MKELVKAILRRGKHAAEAHFSARWGRRVRIGLVPADMPKIEPVPPQLPRREHEPAPEPTLIEADLEITEPPPIEPQPPEPAQTATPPSAAPIAPAIAIRPPPKPDHTPDPMLRKPAARGKRTVLFENAWYRAELDWNGELSFFSAKTGAPLISRVRLNTDHRVAERVIEAAVLALVQTQKVGNGELMVSLRAAGKEVFTDIELRLQHESPEVRFICRTQTNRGYDLELFQHAMAFEMGPPLARLFLKNRKSAHLFPRPLYWLDKQGARFGAGDDAVAIYHAPNVSSLEVEPRTNRLIVNLDKAEDHPMIIDEPGGWYRDASATVLRAPRVIEAEFTLSVGYAPPDIPRLLTQPHGYLATHVWTEHACFTDLRVHRALYFGDERIERAADAVGGFVKHGIPVTKSVFFDNPDGVPLDGHSALFVGPQASLRSSPGMGAYLDELNAAGYEICLHCVQPNTSDEKAVRDAVTYMRARFDSVSWIDHFWYHPDGGKRGCLEAFCCQGQRSYSHDLWKQSGVRYFWNPYYEYEALREARPRKEALSHWLWDAGKPNPMIWRHPTIANDAMVVTQRNGPFTSFATWEAWFPKAESDRYSTQQINALVEDWGVALAHAYPTFVGDANLGWRENDDGVLVVGEAFDATLAHMAALQRDGVLWNTTLRAFIGYQHQLEEVAVSPRPAESGVALENRGDAPIRGVSIALERASALINGDLVKGMARDGAYIYVFDLPAHGEVVVGAERSDAR